MSTVTQAETLLPCPFCGGSEMRNYPTFFGLQPQVACPCGAKMWADDPILAWNTRTSSQVELLEALEAACTLIFEAGLLGDDCQVYIAGRRAISNARSNSMVSGRVS